MTMRSDGGLVVSEEGERVVAKEAERGGGDV